MRFSKVNVILFVAAEERGEVFMEEKFFLKFGEDRCEELTDTKL